MEIGQVIRRTQVKHPDKTDGFMNIILGDTFRIEAFNEDICAYVRHLSSSMPAFVGGEMSIPMKYLRDETYFVKDV